MTTVLGKSFNSDDERRLFFRDALRRKLPELRQLEGFPIGSDVLWIIEHRLSSHDPTLSAGCTMGRSPLNSRGQLLLFPLHISLQYLKDADLGARPLAAAPFPFTSRGWGWVAFDCARPTRAF